jgi:hypothetical protein
MRKLTALSFCLLIGMNTDAQQNGLYHSLSVSSTNYNLRDASIDASLDGTRMGIGYEAMKKNRRRMSSFSVAWQSGSANSALDKYQVNEFSLRWSDGFKIGVNRFGKLDAFIGYSIWLNPSFVKASGKDDGYYTWSSINTLGLYQSYRYNWERQSLSLDIQLPVIGAVSRPGLQSTFPQDINGLLYDSYSKPELISWENYKDIAVKLGYHRELTARWQLKAAAQYRYVELETSLPMKNRMVGVEAGISFKVW